MIGNNDRFMSGMMSGFMSKIQATFDKMGEVANSMAYTVEPVMPAVQIAAPGDFMSKLKGQFDTVFDNVKERFGNVKEKIGGTIGNVVNNVKESVSGVFERVKETFGGVKERIANVKERFNSVKEKIGGTIGNVVNNVKESVSGPIASLSTAGLAMGMNVMPVQASEATQLSMEPPRALSARTENTSSETRTGARFEKFCDYVEINLPQGSAGEQAELLLNELMRRINDAVE